MLNVTGHHVLMRGDLLMERVGLHLVDHRRDLIERGKIRQTRRVKVAHADGAHLAFLVQLLQCAPGTVHIGERLMEQHQIQIIQSQPPQRTFNRFTGLRIAVMFDPHLGGDEQLTAVDAAVANALPDLGLVHIGLGGVDVSVSDLDGVGHASRRFVTGHLEDAETQLRHDHAIAQRYVFHIATFLTARSSERLSLMVETGSRYRSNPGITRSTYGEQVGEEASCTR